MALALGVAWGPDGEDLTVAPGAMAPARPQGVAWAERCTVPGCSARLAGAGHAKAFRHVARLDKPKRHKDGPMGRAKAAAKRLRTRHALACAKRPEAWPSGPGEGQRVQITPTGHPVLVLSSAPWAWTTDRKGNPKPLEA